MKLYTSVIKVLDLYFTMREERMTQRNSLFLWNDMISLSLFTNATTIQTNKGKGKLGEGGSWLTFVEAKLADVVDDRHP